VAYRAVLKPAIVDACRFRDRRREEDQQGGRVVIGTGSRGFIVALCVVAAALAAGSAAAAELRFVSEKTAGGFGHPETVIYDPQAKLLYVSDFGADLKPADKDGKGHIAKVGLDGKIIDAAFLPKSAR
jgi:hypothetical protein